MNQTRRVLVLVALTLTLASAAFGGRREMIRVGPSNTWCPVGITGGAEAPYLDWNSDPGVLNQGIFELSFVASPAGATTLTFDTEDVGRLDNIFLVERADLFDDGVSLWDLTQCHSGSVAEYPDSRAPVFTAAAPPFDFHEVFDDDQPTLEAAGWTFLNATVSGGGDSATEAVVLGDDSTISDACPPNVGCTTGHVALNGAPGNPARVTVPVSGLQPGVTYTIVAWWDFAPDTQIGIEFSEAVIEVPALEPTGLALLVLLLVASAIFVVRRRSATARR